MKQKSFYVNLFTNKENIKIKGDRNMKEKKILDYKQNTELFNETAKEWAERIAKDTEKIQKGTKKTQKGTKKTQVRNFYNKVLELCERSEREEWDDIVPFVKMLNSKVAYGRSREVVSDEFQEMMKQCIADVEEKSDLKTFKLFFEAVIGFFQGRD